MIKPSRQTYALSDGRVVIDWSHLWKLLYDMRRTQNYNKKEFQSPEPMGSGLVMVWTDFEKAAADARAFADTESDRLLQRVRSGQYSRSSLEALVRNDAAAFDQALNTWRNDTQARYRTNTQAAQKDAEFWGKMVTAAQWTAAGATNTVLFLAGVVPLSGAALAALALASTGSGILAVQAAHLKGTQAVGPGVINTAVTFVVGALGAALQASPAGKGATWAAKAMVALAVVIPLKTVNSMVFTELSGGEKPKASAGEQLAEHYWHHTVEWGGECIGDAAGDLLLKVPQLHRAMAGIAVPARSVLSPSDSSTRMATGVFKEGMSKAAEQGADKAYETFNSSTQDAEGHLEKLPVYGGADVNEHRVKTIIRALK